MSQNNKLADAPGVETPALRNLKPVVSPPDLPNGPDPLKAWILFIKLFPMPLPLPSAAWFEIHPSQLLLDSPQHWTVMHGEISVISANSTNIITNSKSPMYGKAVDDLCSKQKIEIWLPTCPNHLWSTNSKSKFKAHWAATWHYRSWPVPSAFAAVPSSGSTANRKRSLAIGNHPTGCGHRPSTLEDAWGDLNDFNPAAGKSSSKTCNALVSLISIKRSCTSSTVHDRTPFTSTQHANNCLKLP